MASSLFQHCVWWNAPSLIFSIFSIFFKKYIGGGGGGGWLSDGVSSSSSGYGGTKGLSYPNGLVGGGNTNNHGATITVNLPGGFGKWVQLIRFLLIYIYIYININTNYGFVCLLKRPSFFLLTHSSCIF